MEHPLETLEMRLARRSAPCNALSTAFCATLDYHRFDLICFARAECNVEVKA